MNVLIIEDLPTKAAALKEVLLSGHHTPPPLISVATYALAAVRLLQRNSYDLVLLDFVLPMRPDDVPRAESAEWILSEIKTDEHIHKPAHIIGVSEHKEIAQRLAPDVLRSLGGMVDFDSGGKWVNEIRERANYAYARLQNSIRTVRAFQADILFITSSPEIEFREVSALPGIHRVEYCNEDTIHYTLTEWQTNWGTKLNVVMCAAPIMGMTAACATALKGIQRWIPRYICMSGIAAGISKKMNFGDILVAESCYDYGAGKIKPYKPENTFKSAFQTSSYPLPIDPQVLSILQRCAREKLCVKNIRSLWNDDAPELLDIHMGMFASGAAVVQSSHFMKQIREYDRKIVGIDMEAFGVFHAAHLSWLPRPKVIVAKSVSDYGCPGKNDKWQRYAAFTSCRFLFHFFTQHAELWT